MPGFRALLVFASASLCIISSTAKAIAEMATARIEIPISQTRLSNGDIRYSVPVSIAGARPIKAMLDTGSFGLRILSRALGPGSYEDIGIVRDYGYGSGVVLHGPLGRATVKIGQVALDQPIIVQIVQSVHCAADRPLCPASRVSQQDYGIGGDGLRREGFEAILGVSMRVPQTPQAAINPLTLIGNQAWIVLLPLPYQATDGVLVVNPEPEDFRGFSVAPVPHRPSQFHDGTLDLIDTELPGPIAGNDIATHIDSGDRNGLQPFYRYAILFDLKDQTIGIRPRLTGQ